MLVDALRRQRDALADELMQARGLWPLLMKHRNGERWSREEKRALRAQLRALSHSSYYLLVLALPGSVLLLPLLAWWLDRRQALRPDSQPDA